MKHHFSGFYYDTKQKILTRESKTIELTKKNHSLLGYLLSRPQQLISREELIDQVWQGRVVTNNTIDQCILKLRKALNNAHEDEYIESVYGQGIRFLPEMSNVVKHPEQNNERNKTGWYISLLLIVFIFVWLILQNNQKTADSTIEPLKIDVISQSTSMHLSNPDSWLLDGGADYLTHLLSRYPNIKSQKPRRTEPLSGSNKALAIDLIQQADAENVLLIEVSQQNEINEEPIFQAQLALRNKQGIMSSTEIDSSQLTTLYPKIAAWVGQVVESDEIQQLTDPLIFSDNEFAIQSYLKAMSAQTHGDSKQALTYLEAAVEQDPGFKKAWYEMAIALRNHGDPRKAIGILNAIGSEDLNFSYQVTLTKAQCLDKVGEFVAAENTYQTALKLAELSQSQTKLAAVYISQAILYRKTAQFESAEQALQQATLMTDADSQPQLYGTIMNTYAKLAKEMNNPELAIEKAKVAIDAFQRSGDLRYQMQAKTVLASILRFRNEFTQAEQLVKESLFHAEQLSHRRGISDNRTKLARIYQQTGRFEFALEQWQLVLNLNAELELYGNTAEAYWWLLQLHLAGNNTNQADIILRMLQQLAKEHPSKEIQHILAEAQLIIALQVKNITEAEQQLRTLTETNHQMLSMYRGDLAYIQQKYDAAEMHYLEALIKLNPLGRYDYLVLIMNKLNQLYLNFNQHKLNESIQRTLRLKPFIYPVQKFQAMAAKAADKSIEAQSLMEELKLKAGDFWQYQDQLLLESWQNSKQ